MNGKLVNLHLVVTAASDEASKLRTLSYAQTDLFLFLYSVVDAQSLENLCTKWVPEVKATCLYTPFMFVGTHTELRGRNALHFHYNLARVGKDSFFGICHFCV